MDKKIYDTHYKNASCIVLKLLFSFMMASCDISEINFHTFYCISIKMNIAINILLHGNALSSFYTYV